MRLLVDAVSFQLAPSGIARMWEDLLPGLMTAPGIELFALDRGGLSEIEGLRRIPFPTYKDHYTADDSALIQHICDRYEIDVFTSTHHTTPLTTPMFLIVHDMMPEILGFDLSCRRWQEKAIAISYARRHISISKSVNDDLLRFYPGLDEASVASPGYDRSIFEPAGEAEVLAFRQSIDFDRRPYVLTAGSLERHPGYKDGRLLFDAVAAGHRSDFDILYIGEEPAFASTIAASLPLGVRVKQVQAADPALAAAYSGACALVYPSFHDGIGSPVLEAMACGCPVITTARGAPGEVAGDACLTIVGESSAELLAALDAVQTTTVREELRRAGLARAEAFDWSAMISAIVEATRSLVDEGGSPAYRRFASTWRALRLKQSEVDVDRWH